jgi:hypothetical protein
VAVAWAGERSRRGEACSAAMAHGGWICAGGRPSPATHLVCPSPSSSTPVVGPDLGHRRSPRRLSVADLRPRRSLGCVGSSSAPSAGGVLACCCDCPFSRIGSSMSQGVGKMRQGPLVAARRTPRVGGGVLRTDSWLLLRVCSFSQLLRHPWRRA